MQPWGVHLRYENMKRNLPAEVGTMGIGKINNRIYYRHSVYSSQRLKPQQITV
jgi:hypothetical protein